MNEPKKRLLGHNINCSIDTIMLECFIDIPQALGLNINECHEYILSHILSHIKNNHDKYFAEEEDE